MWKLYLLRCGTVFVFFLLKKWICVYRLLQRHQCRRGTWSGPLQCADMELNVAIQFLRRIYERWFWDSSSDASWAANLVFCFWIVYKGLSWISSWTYAHRQLPCKSFFRTFSIFDIASITSNSISGITPKAIWCSFCYGFLPEVCFFGPTY